MDSLSKLKERITSSPYLKESDLSIILMHLVAQVEREFEDYQERSVTWSIEDFEMRAAQHVGDNWEEVYDKELFEENLYEMMRHHDANFGITWDHVDTYLDNCKK